MSALTDQWCDATLPVRAASALTMLLLAGAVSGYFSVAPPQQANLAGTTEQWRTVMPLRKAKPPTPTPTAKSQPFSAVGMHADDRALMSWQPTQTGGELILEGKWQALSGVFSSLSIQGMNVAAFSFLAEKPRLRLTLQLEAARHD